MKIEGYGGGGGKDGGGGGRTPQIAPDSLRSISYAQVLDLVCEGEIEGLVNGAKSIYLDSTPLQNADGTYNFKGVSWATRNGTQLQSYIPGFSSVQNTTSVGVEVKNTTPATRTFTNPNLNAVIVTVGVPVLTLQNVENGDVTGTSVTIAIDVQTNGGGFVRIPLGGFGNSGTITGKTTSRYQRSFRVPLTGTGPWDVRVVRITADSTTDTLQNKTYWDTVTEVIDAKLRYPNSALVGMSVDASQFSSIPTRGYDMKLLRVRVPTNYNPLTRAYTGSWDGTFKIAWTDNPAWCFYDMLTTERYGLGAFVAAAQVDKWALYSIAQYCDELVPDGFGGVEPRFTCNLYLSTRAEAYKVVQDMASVFRGMAYWSSGSITAIQDAPATAAALFTTANVIDGLFNYSGSSARARHTVALVTWNDPDDMYRQKVEYVEDTTGIARYGVVTTEVAAIGCTSRGQAHRAGRWLLFSERLETETVTFRTALEGAVVRPGQVIKVADPARAGVRYGGRLVATGTSSVTIDSAVDLGAGGFALACVRADGTVQETAVTTTGTATVLSLSPALAEAPAVGSVFILASNAVAAQTFRVIACTETARNEFEVTALAHEPGKFDAVELGLQLETRSISALTAIPAAPTGLQVADSLYKNAQGVRVRMSVSWEPVASAVRYGVTYTPTNGNPSPEVFTSTPSLDIMDIAEGTYTVAVVSINAIGTRSTTAASTVYTVLGKTIPPENVQGFVVARNGNVLNFTWRHVGDIDLDHYELRQGTSWATGIAIGATASNAFSWSAPRGGSFMIKAVDTSGNFSASESVVTASDLSNINVVVTDDEAALGWPGTTENAIVVGVTQTMTWGSMGTWGTAGTWDAEHFVGGVATNGTTPWSAYTDTWDKYTVPWTNLDPATSGTYTTQPIDVGFVATSTVYLENVVDALQVGGDTAAISAVFEVATSDNGTTWGTWVPFTPGAYTFRYLKIRVTLNTADPAVIPYLTKLVVRVDVPDRVLHFEDVAVPLAGVTLTFTPAFVGVQTVQATLQSANSGDRFTVTGKTDSSVTIKCFDSAGAAKTGVVDVDVFGYGERY